MLRRHGIVVNATTSHMPVQADALILYAASALLVLPRYALMPASEYLKIAVLVSQGPLHLLLTKLSTPLVFTQGKAALPMLKARSAGGRQTRSRTAKTTPKRASAPAKKAAEEKKTDAGIKLDSH